MSKFADRPSSLYNGRSVAGHIIYTPGWIYYYAGITRINVGKMSKEAVLSALNNVGINIEETVFMVNGRLILEEFVGSAERVGNTGFGLYLLTKRISESRKINL